MGPGRLALITIITGGWKGLPGTNTQAYYENPLITAINVFIGLALAGPNVIKLFRSVIYRYSY